MTYVFLDTDMTAFVCVLFAGYVSRTSMQVSTQCGGVQVGKGKGGLRLGTIGMKREKSQLGSHRFQGYTPISSP